jgi:glycosyltransferase involved in cell wall biosynthesis
MQTVSEGTAAFAHVHEIIKGLMSQGFAVRLYAPQTDPVSTSAFTRLVNFVRLNLQSIADTSADVFYIRWHFAANPVCLWASRSRPVILELNGTHEDLFQAWPATRGAAPIFRWLGESQLARASAIIAVTPQLASWAAARAPGVPVHVVPNGVDTAHFCPQKKAAVPHSLRGIRYVCFVGALTRWQNLATVLSAVNSTLWPSDVVLAIAGNGPFRGLVEDYSRRDRKVVYLGPLPYNEVPGFVAGAELALSVNLDRDGCGLIPLKFLEALACATPVIVSDIDPMADIVRKHQLGIVVDPLDAHGIATAVNYLSGRPNLRSEMAVRCRQVAIKQFAWEAISKHTALIVKDVLCRRSNLL